VTSNPKLVEIRFGLALTGADVRFAKELLISSRTLGSWQSDTPDSGGGPRNIATGQLGRSVELVFQPDLNDLVRGCIDR
jgi:hypothetical protein